MSNDSLYIDTPENVVLEAELAGFGSRCIAAIIDYTILATVLIAFLCLSTRALASFSLGDSTVALAILVLVQFVIISFYHLTFEFLWNGQTPGKRRVGIRVVQANGLPATTSALLIRNFVRFFDFLPVAYGVGLIVMFATRRTQRLGDLAAGTIVVQERRKLNLETIRENHKVEYQFITRYDPIPPNIQIEGLTPSDRQTVVNYLQRRPQFQNREHVAIMVAKQIADRMGISGEVTSLNRAETFLEYVARAFELADAN